VVHAVPGVLAGDPARPRRLRLLGVARRTAAFQGHAGGAEFGLRGGIRLTNSFQIKINNEYFAGCTLVHAFEFLHGFTWEIRGKLKSLMTSGPGFGFKGYQTVSGTTNGFL